jgi:DNA-binding NtrC family response regulator
MSDYAAYCRQAVEPASVVTANVLIVEQDPGTVRLILKVLAARGVRGTVAGDYDQAASLLERGRWDLVFLGELPPPTVGKGGEQDCRLLGRIRANWPELAVIMLSQTDSAQAAVRAVQAGCADVLVKPVKEPAVHNTLEVFLPNHQVETVAWAQQDIRCFYQIVGCGAELRQAVAVARKAAPTSAPVLISGESGTGKELLAWLVHQDSRRSEGPYIRVNCAALSDTLLESELFGHEKGAFTGAYTRRRGRFEEAHGGTLLLDEVTESGPRFQAQLLRVLEQQDFERVGGNESIRVNVRVVSTTNKDILGEVREGRFRTDLYYRLAAVRLFAPPLRQRKEDVPMLVWHFVNQFAGEVRRRISGLDPVMMEIFQKYDWPGNVRQLRNVVRTALILGTGPILSLADVSWLLDELQPRCQQQLLGPLPCERLVGAEPGAQQAVGAEQAASRAGFCETAPADTGRLSEQLAGLRLDAIQKAAILATLRQTCGHQARAAKLLGISDRTLRQKLRLYRQRELPPALESHSDRSVAVGAG